MLHSTCPAGVTRGRTCFVVARFSSLGWEVIAEEKPGVGSGAAGEEVSGIAVAIVAAEEEVSGKAVAIVAVAGVVWSAFAAAVAVAAYCVAVAVSDVEPSGIVVAVEPWMEEEQSGRSDSQIPATWALCPPVRSTCFVD